MVGDDGMVALVVKAVGLEVGLIVVVSGPVETLGWVVVIVSVVIGMPVVTVD